MKGRKLYICSLGLAPGQLTVETASALRSCEIAFSHSLSGGPAEAMVRGLCRDFRPLVGKRPEEVAAEVGEALRRVRRAAFLTYGNPLFLNAAAGLLKSGLEASGASVEVLPAVSSLDAIVNMLDLNDFPPGGLRLLHAGLSGGEFRFFPDMDTLVFMPDNLNRPERPEHAGAREKFLASVAAAYPPAHRVFLVRAPFMEDRKGELRISSVRCLSRALARAERNTTLYIPALKAIARNRSL